MSGSPVLWEEVVEGGATWSHVLKRGTTLRISDPGGNANVGAIFYNFECPAERFNMPDTLKAQHIARLTEGLVLYSDMGRIFCSIVGDTVGWHDTVSGNINKAMVAERWGLKSYQDFKNDWTQNGHDAFLVDVAEQSEIVRGFLDSTARLAHAA